MRLSLERILATEAFQRSPRLASLLQYLVERHLAGDDNSLKESVIGAELFERGTDFDPRIDSVVRVTATKLRSRLEAYYESEGASDPLIIDLPKGSYVPQFRDREPSALTPEPALAAEPVKPPRAMRPWVAAGVIVAVVGGAALAWWLQQPTPQRFDSIAVLPFADFSEQKNQQFFCDGLTEQLIDELSRVPGLRVVARTSTFQFRDRAADVREIGRKLNISSLVEGSVRRSGDRIRITAQLIDTGTGSHVWSKNFDRKASEVIALQDDVARAIAAALRVTRAGARAPVPQSEARSEAHNLYLLGRHHYHRNTTSDEPKALEYYEQAVRKDPNFAAPWAGIAHVWVNLRNMGLKSPDENLPKALQAAGRALELDPNLVDGHLALARAKRDLEFDIAAAEVLARKALDLNPGSAEAHAVYGNILSFRGRGDEAVAHLKQAVELDPISLQTNSTFASVLYRARRFEESIAQARRCVEMDPSHAATYGPYGFALMAQQRVKEAIPMFRRGAALSSVPSFLASIAYAEARNGNSAEARRILKQLESAPAHSALLPRALIHIALKENDRALDLMEQAEIQKDPGLLAFFPAESADPLRASPRFAALYRRLKLL